MDSQTFQDINFPRVIPSRADNASPPPAEERHNCAQRSRRFASV